MAALAALVMALLGVACEENTVTTSSEVCPYPVEGVEKVGLEIQGTDVVIDMVLVKAGSFIMGSDGDDTLLARPNERPAHRVNINKDFYISATPITQKQYHAIMGTRYLMDQDSADYPMVNLSMGQIADFIVLLNEARHQSFTVPTEARWEYAARGGHVAPEVQTLYAGSNDLDKVAWYYGNSWIEYKKDGLLTQERRMHPVAQKWPNALGLYDMTGNVWEWTSSGYMMYIEDEEDDPAGDTENESMAVRGASYMQNINRSRIAVRTERHKDDRDPTVGFRIALVSSI